MPGAIRPAAPRPPFSTMRPTSSQVPRVMSTQRVGEFGVTCISLVQFSACSSVVSAKLNHVHSQKN